ncbi:hypothetical protein [Algoriphagus resistens]|uniref:hypothetical protein n=1 Tax=Algoriphagus resistens TaxID=1750590 RepID=UPI000716B80F|nr:hypothetical protein [Algoriphagus resistens]
MEWKHLTTVVDGNGFSIDGLNIWDYDWKATGEKINVKDPLYGQEYTMDIYEIANENVIVRFAAGEFSNCIWGIYVKD